MGFHLGVDTCGVGVWGWGGTQNAFLLEGGWCGDTFRVLGNLKGQVVFLPSLGS